MFVRKDGQTKYKYCSTIGIASHIAVVTNLVVASQVAKHAAIMNGPTMLVKNNMCALISRINVEQIRPRPKPSQG